MHKRLLSDAERTMIQSFLEGKKQPNGFRVLKLRIFRNYDNITEDYELLTKAKEAFAGEQKASSK